MPIEVIPLAYKPVTVKLKAKFGGQPKLRLAKSKAVSCFPHKQAVKTVRKVVPQNVSLSQTNVNLSVCHPNTEKWRHSGLKWGFPPTIQRI